MGFSMEPSQEAYENTFSEITYTDSEAEKIKDDFISDLIGKSEAEAASEIAEIRQQFAHVGEISSTAVMPEFTELSVKNALADIYEANLDKANAFRDAISFSSVLFWIMAVLVGTVQGGIQAVSRSYFGKLIPKKQSNEYYGFFDIFGKFAAFMGPFIYSLVGQISGRSSYGVLALSILFLAGLMMLIIGRKSMEADERLQQ
ncbi:MAG: MFS transporter [Clostridia bacterium]|nr:MFS transporter [Clostridia bacterium]